MDFALSEQQQALRKSAREFLEAEAPIGLARRMLEDESGFEPALWKQMAELGWMGIAIPESEGGLGLGMVELVLLLEEMGRVVAPSPFFSTVALAAPVVSALATDAAGRASFFGAVATGELRLTLGLAEEAGTFDRAGIATLAERSGDGWVIRGRKLLVPDAHVAQEVVVVARTPNGISAFLVPAADCTITQQRGLDRTRRLCEVILDGVTVGADRLLGQEGTAWEPVERALDRAAVGCAAEAVGVADAAMNDAIGYARDRQQFGRAIGSFQAISHRIADMLVATESGRSTAYYAAWALDEATPDAPLASATAKSLATTGAVRVCEGNIQVHGGIGFTWEHDAHIWLRRAKFCELFLGAAPLWRERIATHIVG